jgi:hypothetical protein
MSSGLQGFWTLSILWYSKEHSVLEIGSASFLGRGGGRLFFWVGWDLTPIRSLCRSPRFVFPVPVAYFFCMLLFYSYPEDGAFVRFVTLYQMILCHFIEDSSFLSKLNINFVTGIFLIPDVMIVLPCLGCFNQIVLFLTHRVCRSYCHDLVCRGLFVITGCILSRWNSH